jgi:hypothetical protein
MSKNSAEVDVCGVGSSKVLLVHGPLRLPSSGLQEQGRSRKGTVTIHSTRPGGCLAHSSNILIISSYYSPDPPRRVPVALFTFQYFCSMALITWMCG